ncbi:hypothetical protein T05_347 [Trichinella murrelli]|uniref:Uncharacterized protein n=1 Tax=Trichinella murrelli TaxID=144512 RepID=A0A0V0SR08_9BILA|nr:hypothetical protein T05_347 [Trichinella murrelli]
MQMAEEWTQIHSQILPHIFHRGTRPKTQCVLRSFSTEIPTTSGQATGSVDHC